MIIEGIHHLRCWRVLDPSQNKDFTDNFVDLEMDLSSVMFIATANAMDVIPTPLLDRMEVVNLSGYSLEEKSKYFSKAFMG